MKRGQITVFIILGILLLIAVGIGIYLQGRQAELPLETVPRFDKMDPNVMKEYVTSCLADTATRGVYTLAAQGGYAAPKGEASLGDEGDGMPVHYYTEGGIVPFVLSGNDSTLRSLPQMQMQLERFVAAQLSDCLNFSEASQWGYTVRQPNVDWANIDFDFDKAVVDYSADKVNVVADLRPEGDVLVRIKYPLLFSGGESFSLSDFQVTLPLRIGLLQRIAARLADQIGKSDRMNFVYKLEDHCSEYAPADKLVNVYASDNRFIEESLVSVVDGKPTSMGLAPLRFNFAVRNAKVEGVCLG